MNSKSQGKLVFLGGLIYSTDQRKKMRERGLRQGTNGIQERLIQYRNRMYKERNGIVMCVGGGGEHSVNKDRRKWSERNS